METKDTAVALLKEWKYLSDSIMGPHGLTQHEVELTSISRRLDEMAEAWGISIGQDGLFWYKKMLICLGGKSHCLIGNDFRVIPAREQQAIQEWLLIKNENTKSND